MYFDKSNNYVINELDSNVISGLSTSEVKKRLEEYGENILPLEKKASIIKIFFSELFTPIEILLLLTVVVSFIIGEIVDAGIILFIVLIDVIVGTFEEYKALKSAQALSKMLKVKTCVLRDGNEVFVNSENLVIGDIIFVDSGTRITADARILESTNLQIDESSLTGESEAVKKNNKVISKDTILADRTNMLYAGTNVMTGRAKAIVTGTGVNTELGKIAISVSNAEDEKSPLTIRIEKFSKQICLMIIIIALFSSVLLYVKGYEVNTIFLSVVALAVSAMPEGLSLALTMALTIASNRMSKNNVIVKKLNAVESLGSCTVIASDKTGTLTVNEQTARKIWLSSGSMFQVSGTGYEINGSVSGDSKDDIKEVERLALLCALNNEAKFTKSEIYGDSIDIAFLVLKEKMKLNLSLEKNVVIPYESEKGYSAVFYESNGELRCTVKGSIEKVMSFSKKSEKIVMQNEEFSKEGFRVIAVADGKVAGTKEKDIKNLDFLGLVAFIDPVRKEAVKSIKECHEAGIKVIMITGDHPLTSYAIGKDLGLVSNDDEVTTGVEVSDAYQKGPDYFKKFIKDKKIFSRVTPLDKLHIVEAYKNLGDFIAVTGDGVNDAPAIKRANIGIAMGSGTDVAKDAADMIITDDNFTSIVAGVKEGRIAYANIRKITLFLLSCGMAEVLFYLFSVGFNYDLPLVAIQLLWLNVITDGLQDMALSFEHFDFEVMKEKPRSPKESLFNKELMREVIFFGLVIAIMIFSLWKFLIDHNVSLLIARSMIMTLMVFIQNIHVLNCRSEKNSVLKTSIRSNPFVVVTIIGSIILQIIVTEVPFLAKLLKVAPLSFIDMLALFIFALVIVLASEIYKSIYRYLKS